MSTILTTGGRRAFLRLVLGFAAFGLTAPLARRAAVAADPRLGVIWRCGSNDCPGYEYDPMLGEPDQNGPPGTAFEDLSDDFYCPKCGAAKGEFRPLPPRR